jgi:membrane associated rhomboid family serine protease
MSRSTASTLSFLPFRGTTRRLILANLLAYFVLLLVGFMSPEGASRVALLLAFSPSAFVHGDLWQPFTYSLIHFGIWGTLLELLSLWFLSGFLESFHKPGWVLGLYVSAVFGTAIAALAIYAASGIFGPSPHEIALNGCFGGVFGLLVAIGYLYGDIEFTLFPLPIQIKAKYLAIIYGLVAIAMLFGQMWIYAFAQLGGALAGLIFIRFAPRHGVTFAFSERLYGLRNRFYRWKRRRAARKFEVYMRSQGRTVRFDGNGNQIDEDPDDKKRWN